MSKLKVGDRVRLIDVEKWPLRLEPPPAGSVHTVRAVSTLGNYVKVSGCDVLLCVDRFEKVQT